MDLVLFGFIGGYVAGGWRTGFVRRLVGLGFLALSFIVGGYISKPVGAIITTFFKDIPAQYADMVGYSAAFTVLVAAANIVAGPVLSKVAVSGVSKVMDKSLGAALGGLEAILLISAAIVILNTYFGTTSALGQNPGLGFLRELSDGLQGSTIGKLLADTTVPIVVNILGPFLPKEIPLVIPGSIPFPTGLPGSGLPFPTR